MIKVCCSLQTWVFVSPDLVQTGRVHLDEARSAVLLFAFRVSLSEEAEHKTGRIQSQEQRERNSFLSTNHEFTAPPACVLQWMRVPRPLFAWQQQSMSVLEQNL